MPIRFNPLTGEFDFTRAGTIQGPNPVIDNSIVRWDGITGTLVDDSLTAVQDGGGIEAQGFITRRSITALIVIPSGMSWIAPSLELELTGSIELEPDAELIIV